MKNKKIYIYAAAAVFFLLIIAYAVLLNKERVRNYWLINQSYDAYVRQTNSAGGDGSKKNPFGTISEAIERVKNNDASRRKIFAYSGIYKEKLILEDGVSLYGENKENTVIKGENPYDDPALIPAFSDQPTVKMKNNSLIENFTVKMGAPGIMAESNAIIKNCLVKSAQSQGIIALAGDSLIKIINTEIADTAGKGIYIQKQRKLLIDNVLSHHNGGEGIDLREELNGSISNSKIYANREAGLEFLVGSSELKISNNTLAGNRQDGIQAQFCSGDSCNSQDTMGLGNISITRNEVKYNGEWGIRCNIPSGIPKNSGYNNDFWKNSIHLKNNDFYGNEKIYDSRCKFDERHEVN